MHIISSLFECNLNLSPLHVLTFSICFIVYFLFLTDNSNKCGSGSQTQTYIVTFIPFADDTPLFLRVEGTVPRWASVPSRLPWRFPCQDPLFTSLQMPVPKITSWPTKSCSSSSRNSHRFGYCRSKSYSVFGLYVKRSDLYLCVCVCRWCLCWQGTVMIGLTLATRLTKRSPPPAPGRSSI